ncbi:hypothetical protein QLQ09_01345 [Brucella sp. NM4]|uniref:hypothetical protein n=1 Tax=Brucella/Ochrobactrum group TaxID=2826938 RepID=UPI0024BCC500|nr:hypothetical protein [Brucella sp. NM4]WHS30254.1 hypothetical protein QLQ09_01345 [Brucella sp. NM4]WHT44263.1 hypothetical protein QLQ11_20715 [Ochrobactrum sp. SSR]
MPKFEFQLRTMIFCVALCSSTVVHASGQLPLPPVDEEYGSHSACVVALDAFHSENQAQIRSKSIAPNGEVSEVRLITDGIRHTARNSATYDATVWYHHGRRRDDLQEMEYNNSYVHRLRICEGKIMRTTGEDGYTQSTFGPLPVAANNASQRLDCRVRYEDCSRELAIVEATIASDPELAALRRSIDTRIGDLKSQKGVDAAASAALDEDEARYRRSLRRNLYILADSATLTEEDRSDLRGRLSWRLAVLERMSLASDRLTGLWSNASGELEIKHLADGRYSVSANPVDIDFLKWTCELSGEGRLVSGVLTIDLGAGEQLELNLRDGILHSSHRLRATGSSEFCGANGHGNGVWFSTRPQDTTESRNN